MREGRKHPDLVVWSEQPLNAETPLGLLGRFHLTPTDLFYVRNHGPVPDADPALYRLVLDGLVQRPLALTLDELRERFPRVTVTATLACAGNRRRELTAVRPIPGEIPWGAGAVGNARWTGARLRDVLDATGVAPEARHVAFTGLDPVSGHDERARFGGSIPLDKALAADVLLAWAMNDEPLRPEHGYPVRVVVPGYIGARSVKWLSTVTVQAEPSSNYFQARGYRLFPPDARAEERAAGDGLELGELPVNSAFCRLAPGEETPLELVAEGYALAGGTRTVERVDVSVDGGENWAVATLAGPARPGEWRLWRVAVAAGPGPIEGVVRAWDSAASTQPEDPANLWNPKGYVNNACHRARPVAAAS